MIARRTRGAAHPSFLAFLSLIALMGVGCEQVSGLSEFQPPVTNPSTGAGGRGSGGASGGQICDTIQDDFTGGLDQDWVVNDGPLGFDIREQDNRLSVSLQQASPGYAALVSSSPFDPRGCATYFELVVVNEVEGEPYLDIVYEKEGAVAGLAIYDGTLIARSFDSSSIHSFDEIPYDPEAHRWARIGVRGGEIDVSLSTNGEDWSLFGSIEPPFSLGSVHLLIGASSLSSPSSAHYLLDNVNLPP